jgi:hypothetical protein
VLVRGAPSDRALERLEAAPLERKIVVEVLREAPRSERPGHPCASSTARSTRA